MPQVTTLDRVDRLRVGSFVAAPAAGALSVEGAATLSSTLTVTGAATLSSTLGVTGATTLGASRITGGALDLGTAASSLGQAKFNGSTSGTVTMQPAAVAGTWTMVLPAAVGAAGQQLTDAAGDGVTSWAAAASLRVLKDIGARFDAGLALQRLLTVPVYGFHYKPGEGTQDSQTEYVGVMADDAPWAMHYKGGILNPVNTFGYTTLAIQAQEQHISALEAGLQAATAELKMLRGLLDTLFLKSDASEGSFVPRSE